MLLFSSLEPAIGTTSTSGVSDSDYDSTKAILRAMGYTAEDDTITQTGSFYFLPTFDLFVRRKAYFMSLPYCAGHIICILYLCHKFDVSTCILYNLFTYYTFN